VKLPLVAVLGPTASGKSTLALALAERFGGEIVSCDSAAVYRRFDIGTDKVPEVERRGIPHHLLDVADPTEDYSAARYASEAAEVVRDIGSRGRLPILCGGTGFYFRALTRGLFAGPGRDERLRERLRRTAARRGVEFLHRALGRVDPASAARIQPRDYMRVERALEVFLQSGRTLSEHFAATASPLPDHDVVGVALLAPPDIRERIERRVDAHFSRGLVAEVRALLASGVPPDARPFGSLGYRQVVEHLQGVRDEAASRALIVSETRRYARRQLIWFRKEPNLEMIPGPGELPATVDTAARIIERRLRAAGGCTRDEEIR
jgi:tRNA dimethylallyltransferase